MKTIKVCSTSHEVNDQLGNLIQQSYDNCKDKLFTIGLSGGSLIQSLSQTLPKLKQVDWNRWRIFFCDERMVPFDDPESTYGTYWKAWEKILPIKQDQFIVINPSLEGEKCAQDYANKIQQLVTIDETNQLPRFNLLLLGMGPDGHTASLFPEHALLKETSKWIAYIGDSPKPPPKRVTMTFPVINNAQQIIFVATGSSKAEMLKKIFVDGQDLPAGRVNPAKGNLIWLIDQNAASSLPQEVLTKFK